MNPQRTRITVIGYKTTSDVEKVVAHIRRERTPINANPKAASENTIHYDGLGERTFAACLEDVLKSAVRHQNASVAVGVTFDVPPRLSATWIRPTRERWAAATGTWFHERYGANVYLMGAHGDEKSFHMHGLLIPLHDGRIAQRKLFGKRDLKNLHTDYHRAVGRHFGLARGLPGSRVPHQDIRRFDEAVTSTVRIEELPEIPIPALPQIILTDAARERFRKQVQSAVAVWFKHVSAPVWARAAEHPLLREQLDGLKATLAAKLHEIESLTSELASASAEIAARQAEVSGKEAAVRDLRGRLEEERLAERDRTNDMISVDDLACSLGFRKQALGDSTQHRAPNDRAGQLKAYNPVAAQQTCIEDGTVATLRALTGWGLEDIIDHLARNFSANAVAGALSHYANLRARRAPAVPMQFPEADESAWEKVSASLADQGCPRQVLRKEHAKGTIFVTHDETVVFRKRGVTNMVGGLRKLGPDRVLDYNWDDAAVIRFGRERKPKTAVLCVSVLTGLKLAETLPEDAQVVVQTTALTPWAYLHAVEQDGATISLLRTERHPEWTTSIERDWHKHLSGVFREYTGAPFRRNANPPVPPRSDAPRAPELHGFEPEDIE